MRDLLVKQWFVCQAWGFPCLSRLRDEERIYQWYAVGFLELQVVCKSLQRIQFWLDFEVKVGCNLTEIIVFSSL